MKTLIIEDEKAAVRNLKALLEEAAPEIEIIGVLDSIRESVDWFRTHPMPELLFMDIHLADGSAFGIFEQTEISCPVIFTTAYDEYALKAFKVNSVDYLLKPIGEEDIRQALAKLRALQASLSPSGTERPFSSSSSLRSLLEALRQEKTYKTHFLIPVKGDKLLPLPVDTILFFHIDTGIVKAVTVEGKIYVLPQTLDELSEHVDPSLFFRINRQYLIARKSVKDIDLWFNGRLAVNLILPTPERIVVSKAKTAEFKIWFMR